jgi:hypothetical protein
VNKSIFLGCAIITTLAMMIVLPGSGYLHAVKARLLPQGGVNVGGVHVGAGGVSVDVGKLHIHADQCTGVGIGSNVGPSPMAQARCALR